MSDCAIGIDLGGTDTKGAVVSSTGDILVRHRVTTPTAGGPEAIADAMATMVGQLRQQAGRDVAGVGVGVPGVTRPDGTVVLAPNLDWHHVPFKPLLQKRLRGIAVEIDNDANVAALGEARAGIGGGCESLVLLTLGTGIGGGVIVNGAIHHGASWSAGEIGHMVIVPDGPVCGCGKNGCLEALAATKAMIACAKRGIDAGIPTRMSAGSLTPKAICDAAAAGDAVGRMTVDRTGRYIGLAVANLINVFSPDVVAIGGGISAAGDVLLEPIIASARVNTLEGMFDATRIVLATLGNDAGAIGAAFLVL